MQARLDRLRPLLAAAQVDVLLVSNPTNRRYLSGFTGSAGTLLVSAEGAWLAVDFRYWDQATAQAPDCAVVRLPPMSRFPAKLPDLVAEHGWHRLGVEGDDLTLVAFAAFRSALGEAPVDWLSTEGLVQPLRQVKDADELRRIQTAIDLTDQAMAHAAALLRSGVTEADVAWQAEAYMRTHGAEALAFPTIVAFGPNGAHPHHHAGERQLCPTDPVVIDMGAQVDGYCGDLTRSFCLAPADGRFAELYAIVLEALRAAEERLHAGMAGQEADAVARDIIAGHGYGEQFGHGLGHSLGLEIHEAPGLTRLNPDPLPSGVVETIEPGIYLPDWGGIRLEDVVVLEEQGVRVLTRSPL